MTIDEARRILGLQPDEDAAAHLGEFAAARERIAEMVRSAPNDTLALRYQEGLMEFDQALAAVREYMEAEEEKAAPPIEIPPVAFDELEEESEQEEVPVEGDEPTQELTQPRGRRHHAVMFAVALVLLVAGVGGGLIYERIQTDKQLQKQSRVVFLERQGAILVENRRWDEAEAAYAEIERILPDSEVVVVGRRSIEAGIEEEQNQFMGYWSGAAVAAIEARQWGEAEKSLANLKKRLPDSPVIGEIEEQLAEGRRIEGRDKRLAEGRRALGEGKWNDAIAAAKGLLGELPDDAEAADLLAASEAAAKREQENLRQARELFEKASGRDSGQFDEQVLEWAREAAQLAPADNEIVEFYRKLADYTRTIEVPGDLPTVAAAIETARPRDLIRIAEGTWNESLVIDKPVQIEGAGSDKTILECPAEDGPVITWLPGAVGARVAGLQLRHRSFTPGTERFSTALVRGGHLLMSDCVLRDASGHGIAVIEGGLASLTRCKMLENGWDGVSVYGEGSRLEAGDCEASKNFEHGIDVWDGASAVIRNSAADGNGRNGIFVATPSELALESNRLFENREFGLVVAAARGGVLKGNQAERNRLGGIAMHRAARGVEIRENQCKRNLGPGLVLDKGFAAGAFDGNEISTNRSTRQIAKDVTLDAGDEEEKESGE